MKLRVAPVGGRREPGGIEGTTSVLFLASLTGKLKTLYALLLEETVGEAVNLT